MATNLSRRDWLRKGLFASGALTMGAAFPMNSMGMALKEDENFIYYSDDFKEFKSVPSRFGLKAKLNANENPFGPSAKAIEAFRKQAPEGNYYSWYILRDLIDKIADAEGVKADNIMMGPGSSDLLEKTGFVNFRKGEGNIISGDPPYMSLVNVSKALGAEWKKVKLLDDYQHDLKKMEAAIDDDTKIVYITNPNNPTGTITDAKELREFVKRVSKKVLVFVDEAYIELSDAGLSASMAPLVSEGYNVVVSRTFSKIHGMAGIRVGYIVGLEKTISDMQKITRGGMGISGPSIMAASASMDDPEFLEMSKTKIAESRKFTCEMLESKGINYMPSQTNFVIFPIEMDGKKYLKKMMEHKVGVRAFDFWDTNWSRVSMGTMEDMKVFAKAFEKVVG